MNKLKSDARNNSFVFAKNPQRNYNSNCYPSKLRNEEMNNKNNSINSRRKYATSPHDVRKMVKNQSVKTLITKCAKSKQRNNSAIENNFESTKSLKNEVFLLKKEINQLKSENKKVKDLLEKERERNKMYQDFSQELIKHYE